MLGFILWLFILNVTLSVQSYLVLITVKNWKKTERILGSLLKHPGWNPKSNISFLLSILNCWCCSSACAQVKRVCISRNLSFSGRMERIIHSDQNFWLELWRIKDVVKYRKILEAFQALESKLLNNIVPEKGFYLFCSYLKREEWLFFFSLKCL